MVSRFFRRYQQPLLIVFTVLIIISFVGFFDRSGFIDKAGGAQSATIYGNPVSQVQLQPEKSTPQALQKIIQATSFNTQSNIHIQNHVLLGSENQFLN